MGSERPKEGTSPAAQMLQFSSISPVSAKFFTTAQMSQALPDAHTRVAIGRGNLGISAFEKNCDTGACRAAARDILNSSMSSKETVLQESQFQDLLA